MQAPDYIGPVIAFRLFTMTAEGELLSPYWRNSRQIFVPGPNHAHCLLRKPRARRLVRFGSFRPHPKSEPIPSAHCSCGLYAYHSLEQLEKLTQVNYNVWGERLIWAAVEVSGLCEVYRDGLRAENLEIVALALPDDSWRSEHWIAELAAKHYQVPLLKINDLKATSPSFGRSLDP